MEQIHKGSGIAKSKVGKIAVDVEGILAEIEALSSAGEAGFTIREMQDSTSHSAHWCRTNIRKMISAGRVKCNGKVQRTMIDGRRCMVPAYVFVENDDG